MHKAPMRAIEEYKAKAVPMDHDVDGISTTVMVTVDRLACGHHMPNHDSATVRCRGRRCTFCHEPPKRERVVLQVGGRRLVGARADFLPSDIIGGP